MHLVPREPWRSRALIVAGAVLYAGTAVTLPLVRDPEPWLLFQTVLALALVVVQAGNAVVGYVRAARPVRFVPTSRGFGVPAAAPPGFTALSSFGFSALILTSTVVLPRISSPLPFGPLFPVLLVLMTLLAVQAAVFGWRPYLVELTPDGLLLRGPFLRRFVPWDALAPGGPPRTPILADSVPLVVTRPELVTQRGLAFKAGSRSAPLLPLRVAVHPWFLVDAVRWYAEHPQDRATIGTPDGQAWLTAGLGVLDPPVLDPPVHGSPAAPPVVGWTARLVYLAVGAGLAAAVANLVVAVVSAGQLNAEDAALDAEEAQRTGVPAGEAIGTSAGMAQAWAVVGLVLVALVAVLAVLLVRGVARGNAPARNVLTWLAGLAAVWAGCPCGPPPLSLGDSSGAGLPVGELLAWLLPRAVVLVSSLAVILLLHRSATVRPAPPRSLS